MSMKPNQQELITDVVHAIQDIEGDDDLPRNVREKLKDIRESLLAQKDDLPRIMNKALTTLDALAEDNNLQGFVRTHIWNVSSLLEKLQ